MAGGVSSRSPRNNRIRIHNVLFFNDYNLEFMFINNCYYWARYENGAWFILEYIDGEYLDGEGGHFLSMGDSSRKRKLSEFFEIDPKPIERHG